MQNSLLSQPIRRLPLRIAHSRVAIAHEQLLRELAAKGLHFKPYIWIADDWFCPDGAAGFAVPFYLFDEKLTRLEMKMTNRCEGASDRELMKLMRHECGHAMDNAFGLRLKKERQKLFGKTKTRYPDSYIPNLSSTDYVEHLGDGYAQAHPDEDWAETFALWLGTSDLSRLKRRYKGTKAWEKLEYVDRLMRELKGVKPKALGRWVCDSFRENKLTLGEYYQKKGARFRAKPLFKVSELHTLAPSRALLRKRSELAGRLSAPRPIVIKVIEQLQRDFKTHRLGFVPQASYTDHVLLELLSKKTSQYLKEERNRILM